jgi:hypothetical protein
MRRHPGLWKCYGQFTCSKWPSARLQENAGLLLTVRGLPAKAIAQEEDLLKRSVLPYHLGQSPVPHAPQHRPGEHRSAVSCCVHRTMSHTCHGYARCFSACRWRRQETSRQAHRSTPQCHGG